MVQKTKVLLIEDNEECRDILAAMIRLMGYRVILPAENSPAEDADVIVVYLDFPQMTTLRTISALREDQRRKNTPIVVYLPWAYGQASSASLAAGANEVFDGPLTFEALAAGLAKYAPEEFDNCEPTLDDLHLRVA